MIIVLPVLLGPPAVRQQQDTRTHVEYQRPVIHLRRLDYLPTRLLFNPTLTLPDASAEIRPSSTTSLT